MTLARFQKIYFILIVFILPGFALAQPTSGRVGAWSFQGNANDDSGNGNNGTIVGGASTVTNQGRPNTILLDGVDDYVEIADNAVFDFGSSDFTVGFWVKKLSATTGWDNICGIGKWNTGGSPGSNEWSISLANAANDNIASMAVESGNTMYTVSSSVQLVTGQWYHLTGMRQGNVIKIYVNGILKGTTSIGSVSLNNVGRSILIGAIQERQPANNTHAVYDNVNMYNRSLTDTEVASLYEAYSVSWSTLANVTDNNGVLTKTGSETYGNGATSSNLLKADQDGWIEFVAEATSTNSYVLGFATSESDMLPPAIKFGLNPNSNGTLYDYASSWGVQIGTWQPGDVFRISREGGQIKYYRNGTVIHTVSTSASVDYLAKSVIYTGSSPRVISSFDKSLVIVPAVTPANAAGTGGGISVSVSNGTAPYTYSWQPGGEQGPVITGKPVGEYSVTVTDAANRSKTVPVRVGYAASWSNLVNVSNNNGVLTETGSELFGNGATSSNLLSANQDGWIEFVAGSSATNQYGFGFATSEADMTPPAIKYGLSINPNGSLIDNTSSWGVPFGSWQPGDVFRISREGNQIKYYRNGTIIHSVTTNPSVDYRVKCLVYNGSSPGATTSFDKSIAVTATVTPTNVSGLGGGIQVNASNGTAPYTYSWQPGGEQGPSITGKPVGEYSVTVTDADNRSKTIPIRVGYSAGWSNLTNVTNSNGALTKTGSELFGNGATSLNVLKSNQDGWIEFSAGSSATNSYGFGFATSETDMTPPAIKFGLSINSNGTLNDQSSSWGIAIGSWRPGDIFRISREGSQIKYYRNGSVIYNVTANAAVEYRIKGLVFDGTSPTVTTSFRAPFSVRWIDLTGVTESNGALNKTASNAWGNGGANSSNGLRANESGSLQFIAGMASSGHYALGFATDKLSFQYQSLLYGFYLDDGTLRVMESGQITTLGAWTAGDILRISREGSNIKYFKNDVELRSVATDAGSDLFVKSVIYSGASPSVVSTFDVQLQLNATVTPISGSTLGSIDVDPLYGTEPYTYSWTSGETSELISNKAQGTYGVTVTDAIGRTKSQTYTIGYQASWMDLTGVTESNGALTKTVGDGWGNGAANSPNTLKANENGSMEFVVGGAGHYVQGLTADQSSFQYQSILYGFYIIEDGRVYSMETGTMTSLGTWIAGDLLRLSRSGNTIKYFKNGVELRSTSCDPNQSLFVKSVIYKAFSPRVITSFDLVLKLQADIRPVGIQLGRIEVTPLSGAPPYTYQWSSGETSPIIDNKNVGTYEVIVTDALNRSKTQTYFIGLGIVWTDMIGVTQNNSALTKTAGEGWGNGVANSENVLKANENGSIEFMPAGTGHYVIGFATDKLSTTYNSVHYGFYVLEDGRFYSMETGNMTSLGTWLPGDILKLSREGSSVKYFKNGVELRSFAANANQPLFVKSVIYRTASPQTITSFTAPPSFDIAWTDLIGVSLEGNTLTKTAIAGYENSGAASINRLGENTDGWIEWVLDSFSGQKFFGFSDTNTGPEYHSIDYGVSNYSNNQLAIRVNANLVSTPDVALGDVIRLERVGSTIRVKKNGAVVYTFATGTNAALIADASFYWPGDRISNAKASFWIPTSEGQVPDVWEFNALKDLYNSTAGANWTNKTNWPTTWPTSATAAQMDTWYGVTVTNNDIADLTISNNNLTGPLPSTIGNISALKTLNLGNNKISGTIPTTIGNLVQLNNLYLYTNQMTGEIPSTFQNLTQLRILNIFGNQYSGAIPAFLNSLTQLHTVDLSTNNFTGDFPNLSALMNLGSLKLDALASLNPGPIPDWIGNLTQLKTLQIRASKRNGPIPSSMQNLTELTHIMIGQNQLTGSIPSWIGNLTKVNTLYLDLNQLTGSIPPQIGNITALATLNLWGNQLSGSIPSEIGNLTNLSVAQLNNNQLTGSIPSTIGNLTNLQQLQLQYNQLSGSIPASVGNLTYLRTLFLNNNQLTGGLPNEFYNLSELRSVMLRNNQFSGTISSSISNLSNLISLHLEFNGFSGAIPGTLGNILTLQILNLNDNLFEGTIPSSLGNLTNLTYLLLHKNKLTGELPASLGSLGNVQFLYVHENKLSGAVPASLLTLPKLTDLYLNGNTFTSVPNFSTHVNKTNLNVWLGYNYLDFSSLEPMFSAPGVPGLKSLSYFPQSALNDIAYVTVQSGGLLTMPARSAGQNGAIVWEYRPTPTSAWTNVTAQNEDATQLTFKKSNIQISSNGQYRYKMTNTTVTGITIESAPITLTVGYDALWTSLVGVNAVGNTLTKTDPALSYNAGAMSANFLAAGLDGWFEFKPIAGSQYVIGFSLPWYDAAQWSIQYGIVIYPNGSFQCQEYGAVYPLSGTWTANDVFRISREGSQIKYYQNGVVIRTVTPGAAQGLLVKSSIYQGTSPAVICSFKKKIFLNPVVTQIKTTGGQGGIQVTASNGASPYTYQWTSGTSETTSAISNKPFGTYSVTVTDAAGEVATKDIGLGYFPVWNVLSGVTDNQGILSKPAASNGWFNHGALSANHLEANQDGWMEFVVESKIQTYVAGFSTTSNTNYNSTDLAYGVQVDGNGNIWWMEANNNGYIGTIVPGQVFRISREGSNMKYYRDGVVIRTVAVSPGVVLKLKVALNTGSSPRIAASFWIPATEGQVPDQWEFNALKDFYNSLGGPNWVNKTNWPTTWPASATSAQFGTWFGVTVTGGDVTSLRFHANGLAGTIPQSVSTLTKLNVFYLGVNGSITGPIPSTFWSLTNLKEISFAYNQLGGTIPAEVANLTNLESLNFNYCNLTGTIPTGIINLNKLKWLHLGFNQLSGSIPAAIGNMTELVLAEFQSNAGLTGGIPSSIGNLKKLAYLYLSNTNVGGTFPAGFDGLTNLHYLFANNCGLSGQLPSLVGNLANLRQVDLSNNSLSGAIPGEIGDLPHIEYLLLNNNKLSGPIPLSFRNLSKLQYLQLHNNTLTGKIPFEPGDLPVVKTLRLNNNQFTGNIPYALGEFTTLTELYLNDNLFTGNIPGQLSNLSLLTKLHLNNNQLTGSVPAGIATLPLLAELKVDGNELSSIGNFIQAPNKANLKLYVSNNRLTFNELEQNYTGNGVHPFNTFSIAPQKQIDEVPHIHVPEGDKLTIIAKGLGQNSSITWEWKPNELPLQWTNQVGITITGSTITKTSGSYAFDAGASSVNQLLAGKNGWIQTTVGSGTSDINSSRMIGLSETDNGQHYNTIKYGLLLEGGGPTNVYENGVFRGRFVSYTAGDKLKVERIGTTIYYKKNDVVFYTSTVPSTTNLIADLSFAHSSGKLQDIEISFMDWSSVNSQNEDASQKTLVLSGFQSSKSGKYRYRITNSKVTGLTLESEAIEVTTADPLPATNATQKLYNGLITSMRWRTDEAYSTGKGDYKGMYSFQYDDKYQLKEANWVDPLNISEITNRYRVRNLAYDPNGNILSLKRFDDIGKRVHNFVYNYNTDNAKPKTNQLENIPGYSTYTYNALGQMTEAHKQASGMVDGTAAEAGDQYVEYDVSGKVTKVFAKKDGGVLKDLKVEFIYDDRGFRLAKKKYKKNGANDVLEQTTWYIRDASGNVITTYEENHAENSLTETEVPIYGSGKIGTYYPNEDGSMAYEITDHLGNVRALIRDNVSIYTATMEDTGIADLKNPAVQEMAYFENIAETVVTDSRMNHTPPNGIVTAPDKAAYLYWVDGMNGIEAKDKSIGPTIALKVRAGDKLDLETWARFERKTNYDRGNFTLAALSSVLGNTLAYGIGFENYSLAQTTSSINGALTGLGLPTGSTHEDEYPYAYLNYIVYDKEMVPIDGRFLRVSSDAGFDPGEESLPNAHEHLKNTVEIANDGYIYVWVSNESEATKVWFDDLTVKHSGVILTQATDYGVWGDILREQKTLLSTYRHGYQGQFSEKDEETGWNHFELREYDPVIGRWASTDPARQYPSPYVGMGNNPLNGIDPDGAWVKGGGFWRNLWYADDMVHALMDADAVNATGTHRAKALEFDGKVGREVYLQVTSIESNFTTLHEVNEDGSYGEVFVWRGYFPSINPERVIKRFGAQSRIYGGAAFATVQAAAIAYFAGPAFSAGAARIGLGASRFATSAGITGNNLNLYWKVGAAYNYTFNLVATQYARNVVFSATLALTPYLGRTRAQGIIWHGAYFSAWGKINWDKTLLSTFQRAARDIVE